MKKYRPLLRRVFLLGTGLLLMSLTALAARLFHVVPPPPVPSYRVTGPSAPSVDITEYTDLQCPACAYASKTLHAARGKYAGKIRITFRHFPLPMHSLAVPAATAAECAGKAGKFWEYADMLFENQQVWASSARAREIFTSYAKTLNLDTAQFNACFDNPAIRRLIQEEDLAAQYRGLDSTPTFFVNGQKVSGSKSLREELDRLGLPVPEPEAH